MHVFLLAGNRKSFSNGLVLRIFRHTQDTSLIFSQYQNLGALLSFPNQTELLGECKIIDHVVPLDLFGVKFCG